MKTTKTHIVGKNIARVEAIEKVTGEAKFTSDINHSGMLIAKVLRSNQGHARIKKLNIDKASKICGVKKIVTGKDSNYYFGINIEDQPFIAIDKVRYAGEPVAVVIAEDEEIALKALNLIEIEYEPLKVVTDVLESIKPDAPLIHENLKSNIFHHYKLRKGNVEIGFKKADLIVENEFVFPHISHTQIETHSCIALWKKENILEITSSSQAPFVIRELFAKIFNLNHTQIRVYVPYVGGGFGGKSDVTIEPLVAHVARFVIGQPVKLTLSREEAFVGSLLGRGIKGKIKTGVKKDGKIVAVEIQMYFNAGAYGDCCLPIVIGGGQNAVGPYTIENVKVDSYGVYTNTPFVGAFRGYGHPEGSWMTERQLNIIAKKLNIDPAEVRIKNCWKVGDINHIGQKVEKHNGELKVCIQKALKSINWGNKNVIETENKIITKGFACFMKSPVMTTNAASSAIVKFNPDGTVNLSMGTIDYGQGALTVLSQICAETLQIPVEKIFIARQTDTQFSPYEWQTVASRGTWSVGNAIVSACNDAIEKIKQNASIAFKTSPRNVEYKNEFVFLKNNPKKKLSIKDVIYGYMFPDGHTEGGPVVGYGYFMPNVTNPNPNTGQGKCVAEWTGGCQAAIIEIDKKTGVITPLKLVTAIDAGTIVNPKLAKGQIVGAMVQGLGATLYESIIYSDNGKVRNDHFTDYKIPTPEDLWNTEFDTIFVETAEEGGPYGARSLGEHAIVSVPATIANAISNATGIEFFELPITSEKMLKKLKEKGK